MRIQSKLLWMSMGIVLTLGIEFLVFQAYLNWNTRSGVTTNLVATTNVMGKVNKVEADGQTTFTIVDAENNSRTWFIANAGKPTVQDALDANVDVSVKVAGLEFPKDSSSLYLLTVNGKSVDSEKTALQITIPTIASVLESQPKQEETKQCLKQVLGDKYTELLGQKLSSVPADQLNSVNTCLTPSVQITSPLVK